MFSANMDARLMRLLLLICLASPILLVHNVVVIEAEEVMMSNPSLFVFGASTVDAGTNALAMPFRSAAEFEPYGSDYFGKPVGRWSNGRTFMDLLTQSLGLGFLDPYIKSLGANFTHGVNFASSGSTAQNISLPSTTSSSGLFSLLVQVEQFREYQRVLLSRQQDSNKMLKLREKFSNSIFFLQTAQNDYLRALASYDQPQVVKLVLASIKQALEVLYTLGARNFIVMNVSPLGCAPSILSSVNNMTNATYKCVGELNDFVSLHNKNLVELLNELQSDYPLAKWITFDAYSIFWDGYHNPSKYGMKYPFQACCGAGGPYNFNIELPCGENGKYINGVYMKATKCKDPKLHLIWDSLHPIESFSKFIARGVLHNTHLIPKFNIVEKFKNAKVP